MKPLYDNPEFGTVIFVDGELTIEQFTDLHEQVAASVPIGHQGLKLLGLRLLALAVELEIESREVAA